MMPASVVRRVGLVVGTVVLGSSCAVRDAQAGNTPPAPPIIIEPQPPAVRLADWSGMRMGTAAMQDVDGDEHVCSDWEIRESDAGMTVWRALCLGGAGRRVHIDLGDGQYVGPYGGRTTLFADTDYVLRVRHRDGSGASNDWGDWSERVFRTGPEAQIFPMQLRDVAQSPTPTLIDASGNPLTLHGGGQPASITLEAASGESFVEINGAQGVINPSALATFGAVRVHVAAGSQGLILPASEVTLRNQNNQPSDVFLPAMSLGAFESRRFWASTNGSTYVGDSGQTQPDFTTIARNNPRPWTVAPDFKVEKFATGFELPVNIAFVPNPGNQPDSPLFYVTELVQGVKVVSRDGTVSTFASGLLNYDAEGGFPGSGERGITGICVDQQNGNVYVGLVYRPNSSGVDEFFCKVIKITSNDGGKTSASVTTLVDMVDAPVGPAHQIGALTISPAGYLYIQMGDGFEAETARNPDDFRGKVLRVWRDTGLPVATNPLYNAGDGITARDYVFALGVRNAFGAAWRYDERAMYFVENGPGQDRFAKLVIGRDYLYDGSDASMENFAIYNWYPSVAPVSLAIVQNARFARSGFPAEYEGRMYTSISGATFATGPGNVSSKSILELYPNPSGNERLADVPRAIASYNGSGKSSVIALAAGPDGLYFSDFYDEYAFTEPRTRGSSIWRLRYNAPFDCNGNGTDDRAEIADGTLRDCNGNRMGDACDTASGASLDCNQDAAPDECIGTEPVTYDFNSNVSFPWRNFGTARKVSGAIRLTHGTDAEFGTHLLNPITDGTSTIHAQFDLRMNPSVGAQGIGFSLVDADRYPETRLFGDAGPGAGSLTVTCKTLATADVRFPSVVRVLVDGALLREITLPYRLDDGLARRAEYMLTAGGLTFRLRDADGSWRDLLVGEPVFFSAPRRTRMVFSAARSASDNIHEVDNITIWRPTSLDANADGRLDNCNACGDLDFNNDGVYPDLRDIEDFLSVLAGSACSSGNCDTIDFNRDGAFPDSADLGAMLRVLSGGGC